MAEVEVEVAISGHATPQDGCWICGRRGSLLCGMKCMTESYDNLKEAEEEAKVLAEEEAKVLAEEEARVAIGDVHSVSTTPPTTTTTTNADPLQIIEG